MVFDPCAPSRSFANSRRAQVDTVWVRRHLDSCTTAPHCAALGRAPCESSRVGSLCGECLPYSDGPPGPGTTACSVPCYDCPYAKTAEEAQVNVSVVNLVGWHWVTSVDVTVPPFWHWNASWNESNLSMAFARLGKQQRLRLA